MALVCETVTATSMRELRARRDSSTADMVELRLDGVADLDVAGAVASRTKPVLLTCRAPWEGGRFDGSEEERLMVIGQAIASDADYVDIEWRSDRRRLPEIASSRLVLSHHDFDGMPRDVGDRVLSMRSEAPGAVVKVAVVAERPRDLVALRGVGCADLGRRVLIGMGAQGVITRACPVLFGSEWTYGGQAAPGQLAVDDLSGLYRVAAQTSSTRLYAITGKPLGHSASPAMHNAAFAALGIDAVYVAVESEDPAEFLTVAHVFGIEGASVTAPLKTGWLEAGAEVDDVARRIGAANTLRFVDGKCSATNFDVEGFLTPLHAQEIPLRGARCVVLGAGGAARAAVWALLHEGARVEVSARRKDRAEALAAELGASTAAWPPRPGWDLLVNATPAGTWPRVDETPLEGADVRGNTVYDLVYHPRQTRLLSLAREAGATAIGGLDMLVAQAARQFEHWIGRPAPSAIMRTAAERFLNRQTPS